MIGSLIWKEYREQRSIWLAMGALGTVILMALVQLNAPHGVQSAAEDKLWPIVLLALVTAGTYGVVCGALMLANEHEARTLGFLETLPVLRQGLWRSKFLVGVWLCLSQGLLLMLVAHGVGLTEAKHLAAGWEWALPLVVLEAFAFGMFGSALANSVLGAIVIALFPLGAVWLYHGASVWPPHPLAISIRVPAALLFLWISWRTFARADLTRHGPHVLLQRARETGGWGPVSPTTVADAVPIRTARRTPARERSSGWVALLWLCMRQGGWLAALLAILGLFLGLIVREDWLILWPTVTLTLGTVCGVAAFAGDQASCGSRFLGDQRFPPGRLWMVKVGIWLATALAVTGLLLLGMGVRYSLSDQSSSTGNTLLRFGASWSEIGHAFLDTDLLLFLLLWVLNGFAVGQVAALVWPKTAVAFVLALALSLAAVGCWLPSLYCGGLHLWQCLVVPVLLLATSRLALWSWVSDRLRGWPLRLGMAGVIAVGSCWTGGNLVYRVLEVPDVGDPFDLSEFYLSLPTPEQNRAGELLRRAAEQLTAHERGLRDLEPPDEKGQRPQVAGAGTTDLTDQRTEQLLAVLQGGWSPQHAALGTWLDLMFAGDWCETIRKAAPLPLGVVEDPRRRTLGSPLRTVDPLNRASLLFAVRALQLLSRDDGDAALEHLLCGLALARHLSHHGCQTCAVYGRIMEGHALATFEFWLERVRPETHVLQRTLDELNQHEEARGALVEQWQVDYFLLRKALDNPPELMESLRTLGFQSQREVEMLVLAMQTPWEQLRAIRLLNLLYALQPRSVSRQLSVAGRAESRRLATAPSYVPELSPAETETWSRKLVRSPLGNILLRFYPQPAVEAELINLTQLRACRLRLALLLYQQREGKPAAKLSDLLGRDLKEIPADPFSLQPFRYRVSPGEEIRTFHRTEKRDPIFGFMMTNSLEPTTGLKVRPNQGVLWSAGLDEIDHQGINQVLGDVRTVSVWEWREFGLDWVFLVPVPAK